MSKQKEKKEKKEKKDAQNPENPEVTIVKTATAPKLSPRGEGGITYQVGRVDRDVYIRIEKNDGGGSFSKEWVPVEKIRAALTPGMKQGEPFKSDGLASAYVGKSQCNSGFLVASLRAEQILDIDAEHKGMSILKGDLDAWERRMRDAQPELADDGQPVTVKLRPEPKENRFRKTVEPSGESTQSEASAASPQKEGAKAKPMLVRVSKKVVDELKLPTVTVFPNAEKIPSGSGDSDENSGVSKE